MVHDPARDCFVVSEVGGMYEWAEIADAGGPPRQYVHVRIPEERRKARPFAEIHTDHILITRDVSNGHLSKLFDVTSASSRTIKLSGRMWTYRDRAGKCHKTNGDVPIRVTSEGISSCTPPKVRVHDVKKKTELNRLIQSVRAMLTVRAKLGAFDSFSSDLPSVNWLRGYVYQHEELSGLLKPSMKSPSFSEAFLKLLKRVNQKDIASFYPLVALLCSKHQTFATKGPLDRVDWVKRYNNIVNSAREGLRTATKAVNYVVPS